MGTMERMTIHTVVKKVLFKEHDLPRGDAIPEEIDQSRRTFKFSNMKRLFPFVAAHKRTGLLASALLFVAALLSLPQPLFTKYIIDGVIIRGEIEILTTVVCILMAILLLEAIFSFLKQYHFFRFEQDVILEIQQRLFQRVLRFPKSFFDSKQTGYLMSRISGDVFHLRMLFSSTVVEIFANTLRFAGGVAILFFLHWKLTLISLVILPFFYASVRFLGQKTRQLSHIMMEETAHVSRDLQESISGVDLIKAFATEEKETQKISNSLRKSVQAGVEQNTISAFSQMVIGIIASFGTVIVLWYGAREIIGGRLTIGSFVAFNSYLAYLYGPSRFLASVNIYLQSSLAALERVFTLFSLVPEDEQDEQKSKVTRRKFIKTSVSLTAAAFTVPYIIPKSVRGANDQINLAVIGIRGRGGSHINK